MKVSNILWDTDDSTANLPSEKEITDPNATFENVMDYLSDMYGFCIKSLSVVFN